MLGPEKQLWRMLRSVFMTVPGTDLERVENALQSGTPDVNGIMWETEFWLELKVIPRKPRDPEAVVRIPHLTLEQRRWARRRGRCGGRVLLLLKISGPPMEYFLFQWPATYQYVGMVPIDQLRTLAVMWTTGRFSLDAFQVGLLLATPKPDVKLIP